MKLLLVSSELRRLNDLTDYLDESGFDGTLIPVNHDETSETFRQKIDGINFNELNEIEVLFDNTGNCCPLFKYVVTPSPFTEGDMIGGISPVVMGEEVMEEFTSPQITSYTDFYSPVLLQEIAYLKSLSAIDGGIGDDNVIYTYYTPITFGDIDVNTKSLSEFAPFAMVPKVVVTSITTPSELLALMTSTDTTEMADTYTLMNDIDMTGLDCESIGKFATPFTGTFNGNGKTITISQIAATQYQGLFYFANLATIQNVNLIYTLSVITINSNLGIVASDPAIHIGGFCGLCISSTFTNCQVTYTQATTITYSVALDKIMRMGGMFGILQNCTVDQCNLTAHENLFFVNTYTSTSGSTAINIGGFIGVVLRSVVDSPTSPSVGNCICEYQKSFSINNFVGNNSSGINLAGFIGQCNASNTSIVYNITNNQFICGGDLSIENARLFAAGNASFYTGAGFGLCSGNTPTQSKIDGFEITIGGIMSVKHDGKNQIRSHIFAGGVQFVDITNVNIKAIEFTLNSLNQSTSSISYGNLFGCFTFIISSSNVSNVNLQLQNMDIICDTPNTRHDVYMGGLFSNVQNTTGFTVTNVTGKVTNITYTVSKSTTNTTLTTYGSGMICSSCLGGTISDCNFSCDSITYVITDTGISNNMFIGGVIGVSKNATLTNLNVNVNGKYLIDAALQNTDVANRTVSTGGVIGFLDASTSPVTTSFCTAVINEYESSIIRSGSNTGNVAPTSGGLIGYIASNNNVSNCHVLFGQSATLSIDTVSGNSIVSGVFSTILTGSSMDECSVVYNDYKFNAAYVYAAYDPVTTGISISNTVAVSYGSPITGSDVTNMEGVEATSAVVAIYDINVNSSWLTPLLKLRQPTAVSVLGQVTDNSLFVSEILVSQTTTSTFYRNATINNSMFFIDVDSIPITFGAIKGSLTDYVSTLSDDLVVNYIIPSLTFGVGVYVPMGDLRFDPDAVYNLQTKGVYYLFADTQGVKTPSYGLEYTSTTSSSEGAGVLFIQDIEGRFVPVGDSYPLANEQSLKVLGVGSALLEIMIPEPVPPTPGGDRNTAALITLIVGGVLLLICGLLVVFQSYLTNSFGSIRSLIPLGIGIGVILVTVGIVLYSS